MFILEEGGVCGGGQQADADHTVPVVVYTIEEGGVCGGGQQADADQSCCCVY